MSPSATIELGGADSGTLEVTVTVTYGGRILAEEPWTEPRPWGVTLFWTLTALVVPAALHHAGLTLLDRLRRRTPAGTRSG
ncbi:hypothetical protein G3I20_31820 [Streptomyces sp. SID8111]|uniref:hypothetical protein n=1 Tax=Streptomyces sp. SID8111 TaxID=2706100 RepID=UPI0013C1AE75|nr:hypothetical protein [Streptomyces sp. SID8111]NEC31063.1 hypothetical protein [Streptomyces sp. SID8111]